LWGQLRTKKEALQTAREKSRGLFDCQIIAMTTNNSMSVKPFFTNVTNLSHMDVYYIAFYPVWDALCTKYIS